VQARMIEILEIIEGVSMKGPIREGIIFEHYKINYNIIIKINSVIGWQWQHGFHDE
jgi:hypothetical protein